jgi:hypothetical protein
MVVFSNWALLVMLVAGIGQDISLGQAKSPLNIPAANEIERVTPDPVPPGPTDHFKDFRIGRADVLEILRKYHRVAEEEWLHNYSHVAFGDRTGTLTLRDRSIVRYMIRPGGLATLSFADGRKLFLAREVHTRE